MKKIILTNTILVGTFILFDPLLNCLGEWADTYNLGAEMVLGMLSPFLLGAFVVLTLCLTSVSIIKCFTKKDVKQLIPIAIFVAGIIVYMVISDSNSFWFRLINYYTNI